MTNIVKDDTIIHCSTLVLGRIVRKRGGLRKAKDKESILLFLVKGSSEIMDA